MGYLEDQLDPREKGAGDAELAAEKFADAASLNAEAATYQSMSETMADMGFDDASTLFIEGATKDWVTAGHENLEATHLLAASANWTAAADDLDQQAKARGEAFVAAAGERQAEELMQQPQTQEDRTHAEVAAAAEAGMEKALEHRAVELGHAAKVAAHTALDEEAKARSVHE